MKQIAEIKWMSKKIAKQQVEIERLEAERDAAL